MSFFSLFNPIAVHRELSASDTASDSGSSSGASFNQRIQYASAPETALTVGAYQRAVSIISGAVSMMPIQYLIYRPGEGRFAPAVGQRANTFHRLWNVRPNRFMNAVEFKKRAMQYVMNKGKAVIYIQRDASGEPAALYLAREASYNSMTETWTLTDTNQKLWKYEVPSEDVIVWNNIFCNQEGFGISTITHAREILTQARTLTSEGTTRAATGGRTKGIISNNTQSGGGLGKYKKDQLKKAKSELQEQIDNGYDLYELAGDIKYTPMSLSAADLQFIEQEKFTVAEVARFTGVPLSLLMEQTNQNYKTGESSDLQFYTHCLAPHMANLICELNCKLIIASQCMTQQITYDHEVLHHMDLKTLSEYEKALIETGQMSPNDLRRKKNLAPVEGGDVYYVSTNLAVLNSPKLTGESGTVNDNADVDVDKNVDDDVDVENDNENEEDNV